MASNGKKDGLSSGKEKVLTRKTCPLSSLTILTTTICYIQGNFTVFHYWRAREGSEPLFRSVQSRIAIYFLYIVRMSFFPFDS